MYIAKGNISFQGKDYKQGDEVPEKIALKIITCVDEIPDKEETPKTVVTKDVKKKDYKKTVTTNYITK